MSENMKILVASDGNTISKLIKDSIAETMQTIPENAMYEDLKKSEVNMSFWYPRILATVASSGRLRLPRTYIHQVPKEIMDCFFMERKDDMDKVYAWVHDELMPAIPEELKKCGLLFMKNGAFSNKFDFNTCAVRCNALDIARGLIEINYASLCMDTGGNTEVVLRERIISSTGKTPRIYNGMPLQPEFRIFYSFDKHRALYAANYWDWDYCYPTIRHDRTDGIVFQAHYGYIEMMYNKFVNDVAQLVSQAMYSCTEMTGIWSVDVLMDEEENFWLIDMAPGYCSAYWDTKKAGLLEEENEDI